MPRASACHLPWAGIPTLPCYNRLLIGGRMDLTFEALDLKLHFPFTISRGTQVYAGNVKVSLGDGHQTGTGEAAPAEHYGEMQGTVLAFLQQLQNHLSEAEVVPITTLHTIMDTIAHL